MNYQIKFFRDLIHSTSGKFFSVTFIKRNGTVRNMLARVGVKKNVKGTGRELSESIPVVRIWDVQKKAWRSIPLDRILSFKFKGIIHIIEYRSAA